MIQHLDVDGVPTLLAPTGGPMHAGLTFRVGTADETLGRAGITHLIEHLALAPLGLADYHVNGMTAPTFTMFHTQGSETDIAAFLTAVCAHLSDLPAARLDVEKEILRTEWSSRGAAAAEIPLWRHGARDFGLSSYPEWGLGALTVDDLREWTARWFTRENAVLWITGDRVPAGLRLPLPGGVRQPMPVASSALPQTPAYFVSGARAVVLDSVVRRSTAANIFAGVLKRELYRSLRQDAGLSYTTTTAYEPRGDGYATLRALADALAEKQDAVLGGFIDVLAKMRVGRIEQADLDATIAKREDLLGTAEVDAARLPSYALNVLTGQPNLTIDDYRAELKAVNLADLHEVAEEVTASALLMVPGGHTAAWAGFVAAPTHSTDTVDGTTYRAKEGAGGIRIGADGVTYLRAEGPLTVRYADCSAMLTWPDGARQLIGADAIVLHIEPTMLEVPPATIQSIDARVPADRHVTMPARTPDQIPQPKPIAREAGSARRSWWEIPVMVLSGLGTLLMGGLCLVLTIGTLAAEESDPDEAWFWGVIAVGWVLTIILALPIVLLKRRRQ
ncbi:insulinase family protein [Micromonospora sp. ALFpr18c]|uniref:M16 family metallopeptidase n=1 Tax=Micromonospora sp. ALFpr18c TaxID=1458665 RepID=UPI00124B8DE6|nr:insulinase family protein [Micromonospora sp. ALFpr18c]KAB1942709.1 insulinase family protein [Micromonospora sp. ALFpr18c]